MKYPIISPHVHINILGDGSVALTNMKTIKTKIINKHQYKIVEMCDGEHSVSDIEIEFESTEITSKVVRQVSLYIDKLIEWRYLIWSPISLPAMGIDFPNSRFSENSLIAPSSLHSITIAILDSCCLSCVYCSQSAPLGKANIICIKKIKEILEEGRKLDARIFSIFGGEPTLHPDLCEMIAHAYRIGYRHVEIATKGTLIDKNFARKLRASGLNSIQFSVDSHYPSEYEKIVGVDGVFVRMLKGLYALQKAGIDVRLKMVMTSSNYNDICDSVRFFVENGVREFNVEVAVPVGRADLTSLPSAEQIEKVEKELNMLKYELKLISCSLKYMKYGRPKQCGGGINSVFIFADGEIGPCDKSYFLKSELCFGNINENSLKEIWFSDRPSMMRKLRNKNPICIACDDANSCLGGCILNSVILTGQTGADPMCSKISKKTGIFPVER